jgi:hypothetical protein
MVNYNRTSRPTASDAVFVCGGVAVRQVEEHMSLFFPNVSRDKWKIDAIGPALKEN